jgi:lipopolysaccharide transport system permease protein
VTTTDDMVMAERPRALVQEGGRGGEGDGAQHVTVIRPPRGWQLVNVGEMWRYRELLYFLVWRDVKVRYKQTLLGAAWAVLQPTMMMIVFTVFFGRLAKLPAGNMPYPVFVFAGWLPWTFFASAISSAGNSVVGSERLITKIYFPRLLVPFAAVGAAMVDFLIAFGVLLLLMVWYRVMPTWQMLLVPVLMGVLLLAGLGIGTFLSALNVAYRDFKYMIPFMIQLWMFGTPTVYMDVTAAQVQGHSWVAFLLACNPVTAVIASFRAATLGGAVPWVQLGISTGVMAAIFVGACFYFRRVEDTFADVI